jgi:hypothetical protein
MISSALVLPSHREYLDRAHADSRGGRGGEWP